MKLRNPKVNSFLSSEWGRTRAIHVVLVLLFAILAYLSYRIIPVYVQQDAFDEDLLNLAGTATRAGWDNAKIVNQVRELGKSKNFQIKAKDVRIQRERGQSEVTLEVNYTRSEKFPGGYVHVFSFSSSTEGSYFF